MAGDNQQSQHGVRSPCVSLCRIDDETSSAGDAGARGRRSLPGRPPATRRNALFGGGEAASVGEIIPSIIALPDFM